MTDHLSQSAAYPHTMEMEMIATVRFTVTAENDAITRVTGPKGDEWRAQMYQMHSDREVVAHWAGNAIHHGVTDVSELDGWADLPPGTVTMQILDVDRGD